MNKNKQCVPSTMETMFSFCCQLALVGKSVVCLQALPFFFDRKLRLFGGQKSAVVMVFPLIVLMVDQVRTLRGRDVEAMIISSGSREGSVVDKEFLATEENLRSACLIFSSPEALAYSKWRQALENPVVSSRVCAVIIDEAHCVSKW